MSAIDVEIQCQFWYQGIGSCNKPPKIHIETDGLDSIEDQVWDFVTDHVHVASAHAEFSLHCNNCSDDDECHGYWKWVRSDVTSWVRVHDHVALPEEIEDGSEL